MIDGWESDVVWNRAGLFAFARKGELYTTKKLHRNYRALNPSRGPRAPPLIFTQSRDHSVDRLGQRIPYCGFALLDRLRLDTALGPASANQLESRCAPAAR